MPNAISSPKIKSYHVFILFTGIFIFFWIYNTYLVDRSIINLRIALNQVSSAQTIEDFQRIKNILKVPLVKEVSQKSTSAKVLLSLETANNVASNIMELSQVRDIEFFIRDALTAKESERGGLLTFFDRLNSLVFKATDIPKNELEEEAKKIISKLVYLKDKTLLQESYYKLGAIYVQLSDFPRAEEMLLKAIDLVPESGLAAKALFNLAWASKTAGYYDKSILYFKELNREYPKTELTVTGEYELADALFKKGDYEAARDRYAQLASEYPGYTGEKYALFRAGYISFYNLNQQEEALKYFSELKERFSKTTISEYGEKRIKEAIANDFRKRGYKSLKEKDYDNALDNFEKAVEVAPSDSASLSGMGLSFYWLDKQKEAVSNVKKAVKASEAEDTETPIVNAMFVYINSGNFNQAIEIGEKYLQERKAIKSPEFYYNLGYAYVLKADIEKATTYFNKCIRLDQDFAFAYNNLGCTYWFVGNYSEAIKKFQEAIYRHPDYADAYFNLGVAYFYSNRFEEAYRQFELTLDVKPNYSEAQVYLRRIEEILKFQP